MYDDLTYEHCSAIKRTVENGLMTPTKSVGIEIKNLEEFKFKLKSRGGVVNIAELVEIKEFIDQAIAGSGQACRNLMFYHKDSPYYWGRIKKDYDDIAYVVEIDLEGFMEEESKGKEIVPGYFIPDNYSLAKTVIERYEKDGNDISKINCDHHFRECANWHVSDKKTAQKLVDYIDNKYVQPYVKELMKFYKIKKVNFLKDRMDFEFKKR